MKKRLTALFLAVLTVLSLGVTALADENAPTETPTPTETVKSLLKKAGAI